MRTEAIVARVLTDCKATMHAARWRRLVDLSAAALTGRALVLTQLALGSSSPTSVRHRVKAADRLLGNPHFAAEHLDIYRSLAARWLTASSAGNAGTAPLLIVLDWSTLSANLHWHWLRASVVIEGRSMTLYEEVHPRHLLGSPRVHQHFLERLACVLPAHSSAPILVTDAGFRGPWFSLVAQMGWHWVGRVRNRELVCPLSEGGAARSADWFAAKWLYRDAKRRCDDLGLHDAVRSKPVRCRLVRVKRLPKQRINRYASGKPRACAYAKKQAAAAREPWLLSCSPALGHLSAQAIVNIYAQRMRIEQAFRDTKNERLGAGLARAMSQGARRLEALLLIGHIASLAKRLLGEAAHAKQLQLQLISRKDRAGQAYAQLSVMTLATRVIGQPGLLQRLGNPLAYLHRLRDQAFNAINSPVIH